MGAQSYFALITPAILLVFAAGFSLVAWYDGNQRASKLFAISYTLAAAGFACDFFRPHMNPDLAGLMANCFYCATAVLFSIGILDRYKSPVPRKTIAVLLLIWATGTFWFSIIQPNLPMRFIFANFCSAAFFMTAVIGMSKKRAHVLDTVIYWCLILNVIQFVLRSEITVLISGASFTSETYASSAVTAALHFSVAILGLVLAASLLTAMAMDAIMDMRKQTQTDSLSGLKNRRGYQLGIRETMAKARRAGIPISLVICDIDHFKKINDSLGHLAGDDVIVDIGQLLKTTSRDTDLCARIGGEEFCVVLWNCDVASARLFGEAIRTAICALEVEALPEDYPLTASFGIAQLQPKETASELFKRADAALYKAKQTGRNKVVLAAGEAAEALAA